MNLFRTLPGGRLDLQYLRVCAVYRLLKRKSIGKARAVELLTERKVIEATRLVELWRAHPIKDMLP